jgi:carboxylesterase type B
MQKNPAANAISLAQMLDCDLSTTNSMVECMRLNTVEEVLLAELKMKAQNWIGEPFILFGPTVEKVSFKTSPFITDTPRNIINTGEFNKIPWIIGFNEEDGRYFVPKGKKLFIKHNRR